MSAKDNDHQSSYLMYKKAFGRLCSLIDTKSNLTTDESMPSSFMSLMSLFRNIYKIYYNK